MLETTKHGSSIPFVTGFSCKILASLDFYLTAYFRLFISTDRTFLKTWFLYGIPTALCRVSNGASNFVPGILDFVRFLLTKATF